MRVLRKMVPVIVCVLACGMAGRPLRAQAPSEWVVREVVPAAFTPHSGVLDWTEVGRMGDVDRDGHLDLTFDGRVVYPPLTVGGFVEQLVWGGAFGMAALRFYREPRIWSGVDRMGDHALILNWQGQLVGAGFLEDEVLGTAMAFWDLYTETKIAVIGPPPGPPGLPSPAIFGAVSASGDITGDGYDDFLFDTFSWPNPPQYTITGLVSGASLQAVWMRYDAPDGWHWAMPPILPTARDDLNSDGVPDVIQVGSYEDDSWSWRALSGLDGSLLWQIWDRDLTGSVDRYWWDIADITGDGVRDLLILHQPWPTVNPGYLRLYSGRDGSLVWENIVGLINPWFWDPEPGAFWFTPSPSHLGDVDKDGVVDVCALAQEARLRPDASQYKWYVNSNRMWVFSGADGSLLARERLPLTLAPWFPNDPMAPPNWHGYPGTLPPIDPLGDVDGDSYAEFGVLVPSTEFYNGYWYGYHYVILGHRTLDAPEAAAPGALLRYRLDVPAGAGQPFRLLLSTAFDGTENGIHVGEWNTHLARSWLFEQTKDEPRLAGILDGLGGAVVRLRVPPQLAGRTLYAVAVVESPAQPGEPVAKSSLAVTEIEP